MQVTNTNGLPSTPNLDAARAARARGSDTSSESIMMLPTKWIRSAGTPSARRFSTPSREGAKSRSARRSVTTRLISSGIVQSRLLRPASTCATLKPSFAVTSAAATVEFTSPYTSTTSGRVSRHTGSKRCMMSAVWPACEPEPTSRLWSGRGIPSSAKNVSDMSVS